MTLKEMVEGARSKGVVLTKAEVDLLKKSAGLLSSIENRLGATPGASDLFNEIHGIANTLWILSDLTKGDQ